MTDFKQLLTAFERYAHGQSLHTAFTQLLDWTLLPFRKYDTVEQHQHALVTYQNHPKVDQLVKLLTLIGDLSGSFSDPLGELFMQAISNGHNGQYFSPEPICSMLAAMTMDNVSNSNEAISDPACGSGRMLLAAAKINRHNKFYGADLDITCCKMALINMLLNSLQGEVAQMNTLSNEFYKGFKVSTVLIDGYYMPYYTEFTDAALSYIWLKPFQGKAAKPKFDKPFEPVQVSQPINGVQGSLFD